ncbi:hypothetical protein CVT25_004112 [Psilocybe cyanescens]|uniref:Uncharacterized protein n=1 Tax=Psilocybe cyanescens TaxID=93625 RepID=A0A409X309_PSICY|nr:hypothetical protein CVT25_004112 [Psilocybe cyanescens]
MNHAGKGIWFYWNHYKECKAAIKRAKEINNSGNWPIDIPSYCEEHIIEVFIGKSAWHQNYGTPFTSVKDYYPDLVDWLENPEAPKEKNKIFWGVDKADYTIADLKEFLENQGTLLVKNSEFQAVSSKSRLDSQELAKEK